MSPSFSTGQAIGKWSLLEWLGTGGNSEVWKATDGGEPIALKLVARRAGSEPFQRFVREVEASAALSSQPGILPVIETHLPASPSRRDPAWIAMPIATPLREALAGAPLEMIVEATLSFAETLAALATNNMAHRDIKPGNLYSYRDAWVVGDFGLVALPGADALTQERLGPFGFMPDEMFANAQEADDKAVDVFQLAKTFSVLATAQAYPPQGQIPTGSSGALSRYIVHPRIRPLEELIERCTRREPDQRPSMSAIAQELRAWLGTQEDESADLSTIAARFRAANAEILAENDRVDGLRRRFANLFEQGQAISNLLQTVSGVLVEAGLNPTIASGHTLDGWVTRRRHIGSMGEVMSAQRWVCATYGRTEWPDEIAVGIGCDLDTEGEFWCTARVAAGAMRGAAPRQWRFDESTVPIESSAALDAVVGELRRDVLTALGEALSRLSEGNGG